MAERPPSSPQDDLDGDLILPGTATFAEQGASDGLETDDRQAAEIRDIFATAFPQYLVPIEEIVEELTSGKPDPESADVVLTMLASLIEASHRMGVESTSAALSEVHAAIAAVDWKSGALAPDRRERIVTSFRELKRGSDAMAAAGGVAELPKAQTIYSLLRDNADVPEKTLRKLGAAGLVTVEQVAGAKPEEIAVVAGIEVEVARRLIDRVRAMREPVDPIDHELDVPAVLEADIARLLTEIPRAGDAARDVRNELARLRQSVAVKKTRLAEWKQRLKEVTGEVDDVRAAHRAVATRLSDLERLVREREDRLATMGPRQNDLRVQRRTVGREIARLLRTLDDLRRSAATSPRKR